MQQSTIKQDTVATVWEPAIEAKVLTGNLQSPRSSIMPPRMSFPHFAINAEEFQEYWAIFQTMVHENPSLNTVEKMIMLKESLIDKAALTIKGIRMIPENYEWVGGNDEEELR